MPDPQILIDLINYDNMCTIINAAFETKESPFDKINKNKTMAILQEKYDEIANAVKEIYHHIICHVYYNHISKARLLIDIPTIRLIVFVPDFCGVICQTLLRSCFPTSKLDIGRDTGFARLVLDYLDFNISLADTILNKDGLAYRREIEKANEVAELGRPK